MPRWSRISIVREWNPPARDPQLRRRATLDDRDVDPRQRQLPSQHQAGRASPTTTTSTMTPPPRAASVPGTADQSEARRGSCRKPPGRYTLVVAGSSGSLPFLCPVGDLGKALVRRAVRPRAARGRAVRPHQPPSRLRLRDRPRPRRRRLRRHGRTAPHQVAAQGERARNEVRPRTRSSDLSPHRIREGRPCRALPEEGGHSVGVGQLREGPGRTERRVPEGALAR